MDLARELVEGRLRRRRIHLHHGIPDRVALAQRFRTGTGLALIEGAADRGEAHRVARQGEIDVVGIVAEAGRQEGEVGADAGEGAGAAPGRRQDGVGGAGQVVALARQHLDAAAVDRGGAGGGDPVGLSIGVDLDLVDRACLKGDVADSECADRIARRDRADNDHITDCADALQLTARQHRQRAAELAVDREHAGLDLRRAGEARGVAGQRRDAAADLADQAVAADHAAIGESTCAIEGESAGIGDIACHRPHTAAVAQLQGGTGRDGGRAGVAAVARENE